MSNLLYKLYVRFLIFIGDMGWSGWKKPFWITFNLATPKIKGKHYLTLKQLLQPGDILLRTSWNYIDAYLLPVKHFVHAGIYMGGQNEEVIHAVSEGVIIEHIIDFIRTDQVLVLRPPSDMVENGVTKAKGIVGKEYDFRFNEDDTSFYCSEIPHYCYPGLFTPKKHYGKLSVTSDDIAECKKLTTVWDSRAVVKLFAAEETSVLIPRPKF